MYEFFFFNLTFKSQFIQPNSTIIILSKRIFNVNEDVDDIFFKRKNEKKVDKTKCSCYIFIKVIKQEGFFKEVF